MSEAFEEINEEIEEIKEYIEGLQKMRRWVPRGL